MAKKIKLGKILVVIVLTVLIWVWADWAKTEEYTISDAVVSVDKSADPKLWIQIDGGPSAVIQKIVFEGSLSTVEEAKRKMREREGSFEFFLDPQDEQILTEPGEHSLNVLDFLRERNEIKQLGLTVKSCEPVVLNVSVTGLVDKVLDVECFDETGKPRQALSIVPRTVTIPVTGGWIGPAIVNLNQQEITQAKSSAIPKIPFIRLPDDQMRNSKEAVMVTLITTEKILPEATVLASVGYVFGSNLQEHYKVELKNLQDLSSVNIQATDEARKAYENEPVQILLFITDRDIENLGTDQQKQVTYNFPEKFVRSDEIKLKGDPALARFRITPLNPPAAPTSVPK